jgi:N-methylhydantoinase A/oxoprolinase/acetone carboxylase beta subunit
MNRSSDPRGLTGIVTTPRYAQAKVFSQRMPSVQPRETRIVHFVTGSVKVPVLARDALGAGTCFDGPAIVSQLDATTLVPPGWRVEVHAAGSMLLRRD